MLVRSLLAPNAVNVISNVETGFAALLKEWEAVGSTAELRKMHGLFRAVPEGRDAMEKVTCYRIYKEGEKYVRGAMAECEPMALVKHFIEGSMKLHKKYSALFQGLLGDTILMRRGFENFINTNIEWTAKRPPL